jgi:hypothetical protein
MRYLQSAAASINSSIQLTVLANWLHTLSAGSDQVSAVAGR